MSELELKESEINEDGQIACMFLTRRLEEGWDTLTYTLDTGAVVEVKLKIKESGE